MGPRRKRKTHRIGNGGTTARKVGRPGRTKRRKGGLAGRSKSVSKGPGKQLNSGAPKPKATKVRTGGSRTAKKVKGGGLASRRINTATYRGKSGRTVTRKAVVRRVRRGAKVVNVKTVTRTVRNAAGKVTAQGSQTGRSLGSARKSPAPASARANGGTTAPKRRKRRRK